MRAMSALTQGRRGLAGLTAAAALESSVLPFPLELFLVPAFLSDRRRAWLMATAALVGCLAASVALYLVGWLLFDGFGQALIDLLGIEEAFASLRTRLERQGFWIIAAISVLPLPLQAATLASGAVGYPFWPFLLAVAISRVTRFHGLAALTLIAGPAIQRFLERRSWPMRLGALAASLALVGGMLVWL